MNWKHLLGDVAPILGGLLGGPAGGALGGILARTLGVGDTSSSLYDALQRNPALLEKIKALEINQATEYQRLADALAQGQLAIDRTEAQSKSLFVAGWRPAVGWTCAGAFAAMVFLQVVEAVAAAVGFVPPHGWPTMNLAVTFNVLMALLGMGTLRTVDKIKGQGTGA